MNLESILVFHFEDGMNEMWESSNPSIYPMNFRVYLSFFILKME